MRKTISRKFHNFFDFTFSSKTAVLLFFEIILGITIVIGSSLFFADITKDTLFDKEITQFDTTVSHFIYSYRTTSLTKTMIIISYLGADVTLTLSIGIVILLSWVKHKKEAIIFICLLLLGLIVNLLLKEIFQRPRPTYDPLFTLTSYSFPSGHAMNSFVFYATLSYLTFHFTRNLFLSIVTTITSVIIVLLVGMSRIYLGVHYPSDVIAGYAAGLIWFVFVLLIERTLAFSKLYTNYKTEKKK